MNAKPNIPDWQHEQNRQLRRDLEAKGFEFEITPRGYRVSHDGEFIRGAATRTRPHGRYAEANMRDFLQAALTIAQRCAS